MNHRSESADLPPADSLSWARIEHDTDAAMSARAMRRRRTILALARPLPLEPSALESVGRVAVRPFDPATDPDELLAVNNAAFDWHPDQGGWDRSRLAAALSEHWVDPDGILVHESPAGVIDGFCWTRVHGPEDPDVIAADDTPLGEIWVIATDPATHGSGLGSAMVVAGLDHLARLGLGTAVLFTEESNEAALRMYHRLGFTVIERRGGYS